MSEVTSLVVQGQTWVTLKEQCETLVKTGFLPKDLKNAEQALAVALKGIEVGMPVMMSFSHIYIVGGKPTVDSEGRHYLIRKNCPSAVINIIERSNDKCIIDAARCRNSHVTRFEFSMEDAKRAQLLANPSWQKYPKNMLFSRCLSDVARTVFPDSIGGLSYSPEELGVEVDADGVPIERTK